MSNEKYNGWAIKDGTKILAWSIRDTEKEAKRCLSQWTSHTGRLHKSYVVVKIKLVEVTK